MKASKGHWVVCGETGPCSRPEWFCQGSGLESVCRKCKDYIQTCFTEYHIPDCTSVCNEQRTSSDAVTMATTTVISLPAEQRTSSIAVTMATTTASSLSTVVGIVIGSIVLVVLVILIIYVVKRYKRDDAEIGTDLAATQVPLMNNTNGQPPGTANDQQPGNANGQPPGNANDQPPGNANGQPTGTANRQPPGNANDQPPGNANGQPPGNANDQPPGNPNVQIPEHGEPHGELSLSSFQSDFAAVKTATAEDVREPSDKTRLQNIHTQPESAFTK